ncbi:uncharacterized protein BXZ73DRAFT_99200 [Epithele typhae]|uniref:uncharacterized protein n=1 Tax=Epithele typhae TaxID=378194 RepID=UPI0020073DB2|nr:uncharacterized protein BXZ73DRAFT_99200 [Epithele typhae]KAH9940204.1 hypothetical protein BXZ73DRAFT_99200 [Epithele typhae]
MAPAVLPLEIQEKVIDGVHDHPISLRSCSLVCRDWRIRAQYNLFSSITLSQAPSKARCPGERLREVLLGNPALPLAVTSLTLEHGALFRYHDGWQLQHIPEWMSLLLNLRTLILRSTHNTWSNISDTTIRHALSLVPFVSTLVLDQVALQTPDSLVLSASIPSPSTGGTPISEISLKHLICTAFPITVNENLSSPSPPHIPRLLRRLTDMGLTGLHTLEVGWSSSWGPATSGTASAAPTELRDLERFCVRFRKPNDAYDRQTQGMRSTLHTILFMDSSTENDMRATFRAIASSARLRSLGVTLGDTQHDFVRANSRKASPSLLTSLSAHLSETPPPHPDLEILEITLAVPHRSLNSAWDSAARELARVLGDGLRYPRFCLVRLRLFMREAAARDVRKGGSAVLSPDELKKRGLLLLEPFASQGVDVKVDVTVLAPAPGAVHA